MIISDCHLFMNTSEHLKQTGWTNLFNLKKNAYMHNIVQKCIHTFYCNMQLDNLEWHMILNMAIVFCSHECLKSAQMLELATYTK